MLDDQKTLVYSNPSLIEILRNEASLSLVQTMSVEDLVTWPEIVDTCHYAKGYTIKSKTLDTDWAAVNRDIRSGNWPDRVGYKWDWKQIQFQQTTTLGGVADETYMALVKIEPIMISSFVP